MKKMYIFCLVAAFFSYISLATALQSPQAPTLVEATNSSLKVEWEPVTDALGYYIYFDTKHVEEGMDYSYSEPSFFDTPTGTIGNLQANTTYYVAVVAVDNEGMESKKSAEAILKTSGETASKLVVKKASLLTKNEIQIDFSNDISPTGSREFRIKDVVSSGEISVASSTISGSSVYLILAQDINPNTKYEITVLAIQDTNGKTIEAGVDGIITLTTPQVIPTQSSEELTPGNEDTPIIDDIPNDLNSAGPEDTQNTSTTSTEESQNLQNQIMNSANNPGLAGQNISVENSAAAQANSSTKLPQTGPEHVILVILSLLVGAVVFYFTRKYQES